MGFVENSAIHTANGAKPWKNPQICAAKALFLWKTLWKMWKASSYKSMCGQNEYLRGGMHFCMRTACIP